jgi:hypothetical protein
MPLTYFWWVYSGYSIIGAYRWDKHLRAKDYQEIEQEEKKGGSWKSSTG